MTVQTIHSRSFRGALARLEELAAVDENVFRGHGRIQYHLQTTLERYWPIQQAASGPFATYPMDKFIAQYRDGLTRIGKEPPISNDSWLDWLEHARHHGAPAPLLDFSWSPYIALFFAFNGILGRDRSTKPVVYALNAARLARHWALRNTTNRGPHFREFLARFEELRTIAANDIRFIRAPGLHAQRMQAQIGAFLYCTLNYTSRGLMDLEDYLDHVDEEEDQRESPTLLTSNGPVLTKIIFRHDWATEVFQRLELMNIKGATLFSSPEGVAMDVWNGYYYISKTAQLRRDSVDMG